MPIYTTAEALGKDTTPSLGGQISQALGQGLQGGVQSGLKILAQDRMDQMKHDRLKNLLSSLSSGEGENEAAQLALLESIIPGGSKPFIEAQKVKTEKTIEEQQKTKLKGFFDEMETLNTYTGPVKYLGAWNEDIRENRQKFDSLAMLLEQRGAEMVGKGVLSKPRFEFLKKRLPSSAKTQAANRGALNAWKKILEIPENETIKSKFPQINIRENEVMMIDPYGNRMAVEKKDAKEATKTGYKLSK